MIYAILMCVALQSPPVKEQAKPKAAEVPAAGKDAASRSIVLNQRHFSVRVDVKSETLDEQIQRAMASHPDLRIAQLQVELAQAKLEQERQRVTQRISAARADVDSLKTIVEKQSRLTEAVKKAGSSLSEVLAIEQKLAQSKRELAAAEVELGAAVGPDVLKYRLRIVENKDGTTTYLPYAVPRLDSGTDYDSAAAQLLRRLYSLPAAPTPPPTTSRGYLSDFPAMLDRSITPDKKTGRPLAMLKELLTKAAGDKRLPIVRATERLSKYEDRQGQTEITLVGDTDNLGSWLQQYIDAMNTAKFPNLDDNQVHESPRARFNIYVRNYGLLVALESEAPADAQTVTDYLQKHQADKYVAEGQAQIREIAKAAEARAKQAYEAANEQAQKKPAEAAPPPEAKD